MKKLMTFITLLLSLALLFASCGGDTGSGNQNPPDDGGEEKLEFTSIVKGDDGVDTALIVNSYYEIKGKMLNVKNDVGEATAGEIVLGETGRVVSEAAAAFFEAEADKSSFSDGAGYVIYAKDGSVAVWWSSDYFKDAAIERFIDLLRATEEKLEDGIVDKLCVSLSEYRYSIRWAEIDEKADPEVANALKGLYEFIAGADNSRIYVWMANLYDPETGAFYYANSARDYEGFLPDLESTTQLLQFLGGMGMFSDVGGWQNALSPEMKTKLGDWVVGLQGSNGYFYHPQWGELAGQTRLGRDLMWATALLDALGRTPKYKTPYQTAAHLTSPLKKSHAMAVSAVISTASASYLDSADTFEAYLEGQRDALLSGALTSHSIGHTLNSVQDIIFSRGYGNIFFKFFDEIQEAVYQKQLAEGKTPTGLWEDGINYTSMSGLFKIADMYGTRREIKYRNYIVDAAIAANLIPADDPTMKASAVIYIFNPWAGLSRVVNNAKKFGDETELEAIYAKTREAAPEMINVTKAKLVPFMHDDGSLSYNDTGLSADTTQGVEVSLGLNEGDVNGTVLGINGITTNIFNSLGYNKVNLWDSEDSKAFIEIIENLVPTEKQPKPVLDPVTFENGQMDSVNTSNLEASGSTAEIADDPFRADNSVLAYKPVKYNKLKALEFTVRGTQDAELKVFEAEMCISADSVGMYKIMIDNLYLVEIIQKNNGYIFRQNVTSGSEPEAAEHQIIATDAEGNELNVAPEQWFKIRIECITSNEVPSFKVYIDTDLSDDIEPTSPAIVGTSYYGIYKGSAMNDRFKYMKIIANSGTEGTVYIDNVYITTEKLTEVADNE